MQMPLAGLKAPERPRTRAWVRAQAEANPPQASSEPVKPSRTQPGVARVTRSAKRSSTQPQREETPQPLRPDVQKTHCKTALGQEVSNAHRVLAKQPSRPKSSLPARPIKHSKSRARRSAQGKLRKRAAQPEGPAEGTHTVVEVPTWLRQVRSVSPEWALQDRTLYTAPIPGVVLEPGDIMESSSASREHQEDESTAKEKSRKPSKLTETKLRYRRVQRFQSDDERLPHLRSTLKTTLPALLLGDIPKLGAVVQEFVEQIRDHASESCYTFIDEFSLKFDEGKAQMNYPIVNPVYFDAQLKKCLSKNEAVLQRTVMMSVFHYYWLGNIFDWNTEGQWSQPRDIRIPSREDDDLTLPKPDLAISFTLRSFTGDEDDSDPIPHELERCISPDGGDRCFPFLFMEVKKAAADLQEAYLANLHNSSQALYNMYLWMVRAGKEQVFFDEVRVFSFVFNAQDLSVRVHRASRLADGNLSFRFDEFSTLARYTRDQVCLLVNTIINDYAAGELHPTLLASFKEVIKQEDNRVINKRKANAARSANTKRPRRSGDVGQHTGQSFEMAQVQV